MTQTVTRSALLAAVSAVLLVSSIVADRLGAPPEIIRKMVQFVVILTLVVAGVLSATMRISLFQTGVTAGRGGGAVALLVILVLGLARTMSGGADMPPPQVVLAASFGLLLHALIGAPALARAGGASLGDAIHRRFGSPVIAAAVSIAGLLLCVGLSLVVGERAVASIAAVSGLAHGHAALVVIGLVLATVLPGGARSIFVISGIGLGLALAGWALPLATLAAIPATDRAEVLQTAVAAIISAPLSLADLIGWSLAAAGLFLVLDTSLVWRGRAAAARTGHAIAVLAIVTLAVIPSLAVTLTASATQHLTQVPLDRLPAHVFADRNHGEVTVCGVSALPRADLVRKCRDLSVDGKLPASAVVVARPSSGRWLALVLDLPLVVGILYDLAVPLVLVIAFAGLLHQTAKLLAHDVLYRLVGRTGTSSGRLAMQRLVVICLAVGISFGLVSWPGGAAATALQAALLFIAAVVPLPMVVLAMWPGADARAALCGLGSAALTTLAYWSGHLSGEMSLVAGALATVGAGVVAALVFPAKETQGTDAAAILRGRRPGPLVEDRSA